MNGTQALIYGAEGEEAAGMAPEPSDDREVAMVEPVEATCPVETPDDRSDGDTSADADEASEYTGEPHRNGAVWWPDYEAPDKPLRDFTAREVGVQGECLAARYLVKRGMEVLEQNWRCRDGEIDIVARDEDDEVALVEVKTRLTLDGDPQSMPELAVDGRKQRRYRKLALVYLMRHPEVLRMRFDVIAININGEHNAKLRHLVGTFTWDS